MTLRFVTELEEYTEMLTCFQELIKTPLYETNQRKNKHSKDLQNQQLDDPEIGEEIEWLKTHIGQVGTIYQHAAQV